MLHSNIGPSQAKRILACPGSVALCEKAPPQAPSKYAEEGTKAHEVAEAYTLGKPLPSWATEEMIKGAKMYSGYIEDKMLFSNSIQIPLKLEAKVFASSIRDDASGTCDAFFMADEVLYIIDYKFGKGKKVEAENNEQMLYYAIGVLDTYKIYAKSFMLVIVQPRNGGISEWACSNVDIIEFQEKFMRALGRNDLNINEGCGWCPAAAICPKPLEEIKDKFNVNVQEKIQVFPPIEDLSTSQLKIYLDNAELLESWVKAVKSQAFSSIGRGMIIDGYELTEGLGNRKWKDEEFTKRQLLALSYSPSVIYESKLKSPAQMEKCIPKEEVELMSIRESTGKRLTKTTEQAPDLFNAFNVIGE